MSEQRLSERKLPTVAGVLGNLRAMERDSGEHFRVAADARWVIENLTGLIDAHNHACQAVCGFGDLEALRCQYRPYFVANGRRCSECPVEWKIER